MNPRGVTLVELLVAISIILVVSALSLPAIYSRLGDSRLEAAKELIDSASLAARAESVHNAHVVELIARSTANGTELVIREVESTSSDESRFGGSGGGSGESGGAASSDRNESRRTSQRSSGASNERAGRIWGILPAGLQIEPNSTAHDIDASSPNRDAIPVAVFLPDGMARGSGQSVLTDGTQRLSISINGWIGGASFEPVVIEDEPVEERPSQAPRGPAESVE